MKGKAGIAVVAGLVAWSYFARPIYDYAWIALKRGKDRVAEKVSPKAYVYPLDDVIALNTRVVAELEGYINEARRQASASPAVGGLDYSSVSNYEKSTGALRASLRDSIGYPLVDTVPKDDFSGVGQTLLGEDALARYTLLTIPACGDKAGALVNSVGLLILPKKSVGPMPLIIAANGRGGYQMRRWENCRYCNIIIEASLAVPSSADGRSTSRSSLSMAGATRRTSAIS